MLTKQKGASIWSWLVIGSMVGVYLYVGIQMMPIYYEHIGVKKALKNLEDIAVAKVTKSDAKSRIKKQFGIDGVKNVKDEDIKFRTLRDGGMEITIEYSVKIKLFGNLSVLAEFNDSVEI